MELSVAKQALIAPLTSVCSVVERRQTLPILSNLLLEVSEGNLRLTGSDQEIQIAAVVTDSLKVVETGECTAPARKLLDIVKTLPVEAEIVLRLQDNQLELSSGDFVSHLAVLPVEDFPKITLEESAVQFDLDTEALTEVLSATSFAMASQDVRYFFNGLLLEFQDSGLNLVASNGQRLAMAKLESSSAVAASNVIVPRKGVLELQSLLGQVEGTAHFSLTTNHVQATFGAIEVTGKLIDGTYPDYSQAIPAANPLILQLPRQRMIEALTRTAILSNEMYRSIRLSLANGQLSLQTSNPLQEDAKETLQVSYEGEEVEIGFNVNYLLDALNALSSEQVNMALRDSNTAVVISDEEAAGRVMVISPMKL